MLEFLESLNPAKQSSVLDLISIATDHDGIPPIAEHVLLHLRHGGDKDDRHIVIEKDGVIIGYAHLDLTDTIAGASAELVIHPNHRGEGLGRELLSEISAIAPAARLWSHGDLPSAQKLALDNGFQRVRTLIQMRRSLIETLPQGERSITLRSFLPGLDDTAWISLNNRSFQSHPEQGQWTLSNLADRMQERWFDPQGFLLATDGDQLIAFCWTKIHGGHSQAHGGQKVHDHDPIGEIYVMGVDPEFNAQGLGRAITIAGLSHLRRQGLMSAMLYVDAQNLPAISLYKSLGFSEWGRDVLYRKSTH